MWSTTLMGHYIPLSWMTLGFDYVVWGMNPAGYHLTNVLLHAAAAVLLYFLARRLLAMSHAPADGASNGRAITLAAAGAALLWAVHPRRVESVAWVTERRDVLSCLFFYASVLAYLVAVIMAIGSCFAVMNTMYASTAYRTREIATLRVLGYKRRNILLSFVLESVVLGAIGGLGVAVAAKAGQSLAPSELRLAVPRGPFLFQRAVVVARGGAAFWPYAPATTSSNRCSRSRSLACRAGSSTMRAHPGSAASTYTNTPPTGLFSNRSARAATVSALAINIHCVVRCHRCGSSRRP